MGMTKSVALLLGISVFLSVLGQERISWGGEGPLDPEEDVYQRAERFHGHTCTGLLIGVRLGLVVKRALRDAGVEEKLTARFHNHSCPVDGIQVAAGTTMGNKAMEVVDKKENRLVLSNKKGTHVVEAKLTRLAEEKGKASLELRKKMGALPDESEKMKQLKIEQENILAWFRTAPDAEVVTVRRLK
ncbi:MAG TPA: FmdE family protein [Geomobilimonas sp.]|nr:FmdE family protein [Geomobilimonas sp.]